jgi:ElaB/YqjD/DUF883 family membrane-anchored ribosome-binding protein
LPVAPEEVLEKLSAAVDEAKDVMRELHSATKGQREAIRRQIETEVHDAIEGLYREVRAQMEREARKVIARLERDWRKKLGLDG